MNNKQPLIKTDEPPAMRATRVKKGSKTFVQVDGVTVDGQPFLVGGSRAERAQGILVTCWKGHSLDGDPRYRIMDVAARGSLSAAQSEAIRNSTERIMRSSRYGNMPIRAAIWSVAIPVEEQ
jgi:hypothetical protein